jgi:hypothetical protein
MENKISHLKASLIGQIPLWNKAVITNQCLCCVLAEIISKKETLQSEFVKRYLLAVAKQVCKNKQRGFEYVKLHARNVKGVYTQTPVTGQGP